MALQSVRLRGILSCLSTLHRSFSIITPTPISAPLSPHQTPPPPSTSPSFSFFQSRAFVGSRISLASGKREYKLYKEGDEITEDTILFEGCDYNHWLITMEFPNDPRPSPEEMVAVYEQTCAKGLNISVEEARKRIYACSTTTYVGFQAVMTEEESEKFRDIPGVVFILPDSYIDPQNKEYGGDKYENGVITHRPPPVQFQSGRRGMARNREQNRTPYEQRYDRRGPMQNHQGSNQYGQQGTMQGAGRNYGPPPEQQYGSPGQGERRPVERNYGLQQQQQYGPSGEGERRPLERSYGPPSQQQYGPPGLGERRALERNYGPPPQQQYGPPGQGETRPLENRGFTPGGSNTYQSGLNNPMPPYVGNYSQGQQGNPGTFSHGQQGQGSYYSRQQADHYPPAKGGFQQGDWRANGPPGQRESWGDNRNYSDSQMGSYGQGTNSGYGHGQPSSGQNFALNDQRQMQEEQRNYQQMGQTDPDQGRY